MDIRFVNVKNGEIFYCNGSRQYRKISTHLPMKDGMNPDCLPQYNAIEVRTGRATWFKADTLVDTESYKSEADYK